MEAKVRTRRLRIAMRVISLYSFVFIPWIILIAMNSPFIAEGSFVAHIFRFEPFNKAYEAMIASIYIAWGIILWRASANPDKHLAFIDFTALANGFHGIVMIIVTTVYKGELYQIILESTPWLLIAMVLFWLRPAPTQTESQTERATGGGPNVQR